MEDTSPTALQVDKHPLIDNESSRVPSLLTLSHSDLTGDRDVSNDNDGSLVLLQLPSSINVKDLCSSRIVAKDDQQQACVVMEATGQSFGISRVETSNALVLVPPLTTTQPENKSSSQEPPPSKRAKTSIPSGNLFSVPARLLQPGGSQSSFLELKEHKLDVKELKKQLQNFVFNPYNDYSQPMEWKGRSLKDLALQMQCSERQVKVGLETIGVFGMPRTDIDTVVGYGFLSEEATQEALKAVVATLAECDEFMDFVKLPVSVDSLVKETTTRMESDGYEASYPQIQYVVRHCLKTLLATNQSEDTAKALLDFDKVACCVAHGVFQSQSQPWEESSFLTRWQSMLPSVDRAPSMDLLRGVAIEIATPSSDRVWTYVPHEKLSAEPGARFEQLFAVKEKWTLQDITPYLETFVEELSMSQSELLTKYSEVATEEVDGVPAKYYTKR